MEIQTKKQSDLEKRLKLLRQQVYGKIDKENQVISPQFSSENSARLHPTSHIPHPTSNPAAFQSDITYLRQDLLKIFILSTSALGIQIILFILSKNHILNLKFF